jgi:hypothetical protein
MRSLAERISRTLVRRYPRAWRERYGDEMLALIDDAGSTWKHALDLAVGCVDAWLRAPTRFDSTSYWIAAFLGAVSVRVGSVVAIYLGLIPPAPLQKALQGAFALLALFGIGLMFLLGFLAFAVAFRRAWRQWFEMTRGHLPEPIDPRIATARIKTNADLGPTRRQVRMLAAVTILIAIGADISTPDRKVSEFLRLSRDFVLPPLVPMLTFWLLGPIRMCVSLLPALRQMVSGRWHRHRLE